MTDATTDSPPAAAQPTAAPPPATPRRNVMWSIVLVLAALAGITLVLYAWRLPPFSDAIQRTDNAYVRGQVTIIAPQVNGYVSAVPVQDYQVVQAGQLLAQIDDRIYRQRLEQAVASLHSAEAALANSAQSQSSARGSVASSQAAIAGAQANLAKAQADADRVRRLHDGGWVAQAQVDVAEAALRSARATLAQTKAQEAIAETSVTTAVVGKGSLEAAVENARAQVRLAQIDLDNTRIAAPRAGRLGEIGVKQGQYVATGTQLMALVPDTVWVVANMKETQMKRVRVGQPVALTVDALGGQEIRGKVERIAPATGSEFSVIKPDNATGNFTKVAQRIPVRIAITPGQEGAQRLAPGMSVVARIDTR
ncbi:HlyD family secretion protein [Caulobacter mirabilis]|nr:HlyD family secretion protein [Caulobacter mirabilis]